MQAPYKE